MPRAPRLPTRARGDFLVAFTPARVVVDSHIHRDAADRRSDDRAGLVVTTISRAATIPPSDPPATTWPHDTRPGLPVPCTHCGDPIVATEIGWTHTDAGAGRDAGWLCPLPHMTLATPAAAPTETVTPSPHASRASRHRARPVPTPIPARSDGAGAPQDWPPPPSDRPWWLTQP